MLAIFGFRKNRSQMSGQGCECSAEFYGDVGPMASPATLGCVYTQTHNHKRRRSRVDMQILLFRPGCYKVFDQKGGNTDVSCVCSHLGVSRPMAAAPPLT